MDKGGFKTDRNQCTGINFELNSAKAKNMKKIFFILTMVLISVDFSFAQTTWKDDPFHSKLTFTVVHKGFNDIFGLFQKFDASVTASQPDFSDAIFTLSADVSSINTEVTMRDDDLRSAHFFDIAKYPVMTFKSTSISATGEKNRYKISGDLTLHGVTKPITMDLWFRGTIEDAMSKKTKAGFQLTGTLNRLDFNVGPPSGADISTDVRIKADGEFVKQ
jgi:polyisoprenoid-binding protein YceI